MNNNRFCRITAAVLLFWQLVSLGACGDSGEPVDPVTDTTAPVTTDETTAKKADTTAPDTTKPVEKETDADTTAADTIIIEETTAAPSDELPEILNPLTGLEASEDFSGRRPVAIMINNIKQANPQEGISLADIIYECVVEGQVTRLMAVVSDWENLTTIGSVRSSREYYLDFAANHDALYVHAGGSESAYVELKERGVDNLDAVNQGYYVTSNFFWRDYYRREVMGYDHSLMTDGESIAAGIKYKKYDTELASDFDSPLDFVEWNTVYTPDDGTAEFLKVKYSNIHHPYFEYNSERGVYYRWQFQGDPHVDDRTRTQLSFTNVIVLYLPTVNTKDDYNHMSITTTGSGEGYYLTKGKYEKIRWEKDDKDSPVKLYDSDGGELLVNRGKTFFQICTEAMKNTTELR